MQNDPPFRDADPPVQKSRFRDADPILDLNLNCNNVRSALHQSKAHNNGRKSNTYEATQATSTIIITRLFHQRNHTRTRCVNNHHQRLSASHWTSRIGGSCTCFIHINLMNCADSGLWWPIIADHVNPTPKLRRVHHQNQRKIKRTTPVVGSFSPCWIFEIWSTSSAKKHSSDTWRELSYFILLCKRI